MSNTARVLMISGEYPPLRGGVGDYTAQLVNALARQGYAPQVLTGSVPGPVEPTTPAAWRRVGDWGFACWPRIEAAIDEFRSDVLHIQYQPGAYQLKGAINLLPLWLRARRPAVRTVTTFHDLRVPYLVRGAGAIRPLAVQALLRGSHGTILVDESDMARVGPGRNRCWVPVGSNIPCDPPDGFDRATVRRALGAGDRDLVVGFFGFLTASKGADDLLRALRILRDTGRQARLVLIGATAGSSNPTDHADSARALGLARDLAVEAYLRPTGYLPPREVSAHLLACDLLALPYADGASFRRGSLLAALEHGRPIITTTPSIPAPDSELRFESERQVLLIPPRDPPALARAIARLADDSGLAARLAQHARMLAKRCNWDAIAEKTAGVYRSCAP